MQAPSPRRGQHAPHAPSHAHGDAEENQRGRHGFRAQQRPDREHSIDANPKAGASDAAEKKGGKSKDLSHVPCKFHRQGSCTAGKACPFSHDLTVPGTTKPVCQWYAKGNCKFGHKCALAHILPGQPLSWDRKNKRAAQAALREAGEQVVMPNSPQQNGVVPPSASGIGRSLVVDAREGIAGEGEQVGFGTIPFGTPPRKSNLGPTFSPVVGHSPRHDTPTNEREDLAFGFPDDFDVGPDPPVLAYRSSTDSPSRPSPLNGSSLFAPSSPTLSGLSQTLPNGLSPRSAITQHGALSSSQRRLSSNMREASPSRLQQLQNPTSARRSFGAHETLFPSATPLAVPGATNINTPYGQTSSSGIFGTSPFSGSRSLFMPSSSYDSDDAFPRSPKPKSTNLLDDPRRAASSPWDRHVGVFDDEDDDDEYDEAFLPSSLNELLTPEEQRRRSTRMSGGGNQFSPFHSSQSVPAVFNLASRGESALRTSNSFNPSQAWDTNDSTYSPPLVPRSLLSVGQPSSLSASLDQSYAHPHPPASPSLRSQILVKNNAIYSASFDPSSNFGIRYQPGQEFSPRASPKTLAKNLGLMSIGNGSGNMGSSLPKGLAAGLSTLHFIPAEHSGETPPTTNVFPSSSSGGGAHVDEWETDPGFVHQRQETIRGSTYANLLSGSPTAGAEARPRSFGPPSTSTLKHSAVDSNSFSPPPPSNRSVEHDEIQFDMED